jgi:hypothetical protein
MDVVTLAVGNKPLESKGFQGYRSKAEIDRDKAIAYERKKKEEYEAKWGWRDEGRDLKNKLDKQFSRVEGIIAPHKHKKSMVHLIEKFSRKANRTKNVFRRPFGMWLMRTVINHRLHGQRTPKSALIRIKWNMLAEIRKVGDLDESECLRPIEKMLVKNVRINRETVDTLKMLRSAVEDAKYDLKLRCL